MKRLEQFPLSTGSVEIMADKMAAGHVFLLVLLRISLSLYLLKILKSIFRFFTRDTV
jgi:hypothetical protein